MFIYNLICYVEESNNRHKQSGTDHGLPERHEENAEELAVMLFPLNNQLAD
jgi:hypothetical protein